MDKNIEQRICLKFCIANGISCAESLKMLHKAYGKSTISKTRAYEWYNAFKSGRKVVENLPRSGRPSTSATEVNIAKVKEMLSENQHISLREIAAKLSVSHESIRRILNVCLGMKRVATRVVPKDLNLFQELNRLMAVENILERVNSDPISHTSQIPTPSKRPSSSSPSVKSNEDDENDCASVTSSVGSETTQLQNQQHSPNAKLTVISEDGVVADAEPPAKRNKADKK